LISSASEEIGGTIPTKGLIDQRLCSKLLRSHSQSSWEILWCTRKGNGKCANKELDILQDLFGTPLVALAIIMGTFPVVSTKFVGSSSVYWWSWSEYCQW
jgi:hypothetical protein